MITTFDFMGTGVRNVFFLWQKKPVNTTLKNARISLQKLLLQLIQYETWKSQMKFFCGLEWLFEEILLD